MKKLFILTLLLVTANWANGQQTVGAPLPPTKFDLENNLGGGHRQRLSAVVPINVKYSVNAAQLAAISGTTSGDLTLGNLPAKAVVLTTTVKHSTAVSGTSISAATARVITANNNYGTAFDVFQAPGNTVLDFYATPKSENFAAVTPLLLHITTTGANMSAISAGAIDIWVTYYVRQ